MRDQFKEFSGGIYEHPRVRVFVDDGRSFVRRSEERYDVIQASLVDTWAATAAGAYTLTENTLYTVEAFDDYLQHLTDDGVLTITRWVFDGLRLVSLAQEVCERREMGLQVPHRHRPAQERPDVPDEAVALHARRNRAPADGRRASWGSPSSTRRPSVSTRTTKWTASAQATTGVSSRRRDRRRFYEAHPQDIRPTTDDRPFFFHTTKLANQFDVAFGRSMLFGNGLSALLTLMGISGRSWRCSCSRRWRSPGAAGRAAGWRGSSYFGALGAGFMLIEVAMLQRFVLLLGHPVYSLTVTLFSLLLGTGIGAALSRRLGGPRARTVDRPEPGGDRRVGMRGDPRRHAAHDVGHPVRSFGSYRAWRWPRSCRSGCSLASRCRRASRC